MNRFRDELHERGLRITPQREAILSALHHLPMPTTAEEIFRQVKEVQPGTRLSTVYRTLELLRSFGLVAALDSGTRSHLYLHDASEAPHIHLHCGKCGKTSTVDLAEVHGLIAHLESRFGFQLQMNGMSLYGTCAQCR
jgi:Fur family ferric uptake transcriptional regulator